MAPRIDFTALERFLQRVPSIQRGIGTGAERGGLWWAKFGIDIDHPLAWRVVQELGHVLNYLSINERLPTMFVPVSPPPYMNGGPRDYLSWVIESRDRGFTPDLCAEWLEGRLPAPVDNLAAWKLHDDARAPRRSRATRPAAPKKSRSRSSKRKKPARPRASGRVARRAPT